MGLRGPKPSTEVADREHRVCREYLKLLVLGYYTRCEIIVRVADVLGMEEWTVLRVLDYSSPDGCYYDEPKAV